MCSRLIDRTPARKTRQYSVSYNITSFEKKKKKIPAIRVSRPQQLKQICSSLLNLNGMKTLREKKVFARSVFSQACRLDLENKHALLFFRCIVWYNSV